MLLKVRFAAAALGLLLGLQIHSAAAVDDYMGHCTHDGTYTPHEVVSSCEVFIDHVFKEGWKGEYLPAAYYNLALAYKALGDTANQKRFLQLSVRYGPDYVDAWREIVEVMSNLRGDDSTIKAVDLMIAAHPTNPYVLNEACWTRATMGLQLDTALADCNESLRLSPGYANALNSRGFAEYRLVNYAGAISDNTAALVARPNDAASLYVRGLARLKTGQTADGNADVAAAKAINPGIADVYAKYGVTP